MKIWIDLTNSPHVIFFKPIIKELKKKNQVFITARKHSQTLELLDLFRFKYSVVGKHVGKSKILKASEAVYRGLRLMKLMRNKKIDEVVVHQSPYAIVAAFFLGIKKRVYIFDNETAKLQNSLAIPYATKVICPESIRKKRLFGKKLIKYSGLKEEVAFNNFKPNPKILKELKLNKKKKIIVMRPEPWSASYYNKKEDILTPLLKELSKNKNYQIVVIPRDEKQKKHFKNLDVVIPEKAVDGPSLTYYSDLVIGGGGTMNREAAALGTNVLSTYQGELLSVDKWLISEKKVVHKLNPTVKDVRNLLKQKKKTRKINRNGFKKILEEIK